MPTGVNTRIMIEGQHTAIHLEVRRQALMLSLRKAFEREVIALTSRPPANEALNAWLFTQIARSHAAGIVADGDEQLFVPLVAASDSVGAEGHDGAAWPLVKYLLRARARAGERPDDQLVSTQAHEMDMWLREAWEERRSALYADVQGDEVTSYTVVSERSETGYAVELNPKPGGQLSRHSVNNACLEKLRSGFSGLEEEFDTRFFLLCHRYATLFGPHSSEGRGWQLATPPKAMDQLGTDFGVDAECFASPFNRRHARFCSAFADTDVPFGSSGNFFASRRNGTLRTFSSAECGPPYDDALMAMAIHMLDAELEQREEASTPGTFVLVVPDWRFPTPSAFCQAFAASRFLTHVESLGKDEHRYVEGFQHLATGSKKKGKQQEHRMQFVMGETATLLVWLQNEAGTKRHPVTRDAVERQRRAWNVGPLGP